MRIMTSSEIRSRFLQFFEKRGHAILPSASLVPENDPSVLFNTAGMQPLVPYLMGQKHPLWETDWHHVRNVCEQEIWMILVIIDIFLFLRCSEIGHLVIISKMKQLNGVMNF
jgi:hypothetical protein